MILASWILLAIGSPGMGILLVALMIASLLFAVCWRSALPLIFLLLNPIPVDFGLGLHEWFEEKPRFSYMGLPGNEFYNLDPVTRCYRETGGCVIRGDEWIIQSPRNAGLRWMVRLFGYPGHTYHGPYPSKMEAVSLTETNSATPPELFLNGRVLVNGKTIAIGQDAAKMFLQDFQMTFFEIESKEFVRNVRAAIFKDRCLVVRAGVKERMSDGSFTNESEGIVLFDLDNNRAFARYVLAGDAQRIPRLLAE